MPFSDQERRLLVQAPRLGPAVVGRLEDAGLESLAALRQLGVDAVVQRVCQQLGSPAFGNRRKALEKLLASCSA